MTDQNNGSGFKELQQMFGLLEPLRTASAKSWVGYWRGQDRILDSMEQFARGWFERRHEATATALRAAERACETSTPADFMREIQAWTTGSMERIAADGLAYQKHLMTVAELMRPESPFAGDEAVAPRPATGERAHSAAERAKAA